MNRIIVDVTPEQKKALDKYLPWGTGRRVFSAMIDSFIKACETDQSIALGAFLNGDVEIVVKEKKDNATI